MGPESFDPVRHSNLLQLKLGRPTFVTMQLIRKAAYLRQHRVISAANKSCCIQ